MTIPQWVLLGFAVWTLIILCGTVGTYRWSMILAGRAKVSHWRADELQGIDWYRRAMRAHMNCVENLPVYAAIVLCMTVTDSISPLVNLLAIVFLTARVLQTTIHIAFEQTDRIASMRFGCFFVQVLCMLVMAVRVGVFAGQHGGATVLHIG